MTQEAEKGAYYQAGRMAAKGEDLKERAKETAENIGEKARETYENLSGSRT